MKFSENALNVATLLKIKGIGRAWIVKNFSANLSEGEIISLIKQKNSAFGEGEFYECKDETKAQLAALKDSADGIIAINDEDFPNFNARGIKDGDKPILLAYKGDLKLLSRQNLLKIAVIGLLTPDEKIKRFEEKILDKMLAKDTVIVSGLAKGCDEIAHRHTLAKNGATIAILPSTLQKILPASNAELAQEIVLKGGLLVSEYLRECENPKFELAQRYIERDRLQALFSDAVCLIASYSQSDKQADKSKDAGSRHALNAAREWGIKRLAPRGLEGDERFNLNREILGIGGNFENVKGGEFSSGNAVEINGANIEFVLDEIAKRKSQGLKPQPNETAELNLFD